VDIEPPLSPALSHRGERGLIFFPSLRWEGIEGRVKRQEGVEERVTIFVSLVTLHVFRLL